MIGGSGSIGLLTVRQFHERGARVEIVGRDDEDLDEVKADLCPDVFTI